MATDKNCPCGSKKKIQYCCQKYIVGKAKPQTAEQLMRSRYTAFCLGEIDYLVETLHPDKRQANDRKELAKTIKQTTWLNLIIVNTAQGKKSDRTGTVEFVAAFQISEPKQLHECSRFQKIENKWFYVDGDILPDYIPNNNDLCWCGSKKKYHKCHK